MSIQEIINKAYRELESLSQTSADAFAAERNRRFHRLLEHHIHNARNTAYADLWRSHGLDPLVALLCPMSWLRTALELAARLAASH